MHVDIFGYYCQVALGGAGKKPNFTPTEQCKGMTTNNSSSEMIRNGKHEKSQVFKKQRSVLFFQIN